MAEVGGLTVRVLNCEGPSETALTISVTLGLDRGMICIREEKENVNKSALTTFVQNLRWRLSGLYIASDLSPHNPSYPILPRT